MRKSLKFSVLRIFFQVFETPFKKFMSSKFVDFVQSRYRDNFRDLVKVVLITEVEY